MEQPKIIIQNQQEIIGYLAKNNFIETFMDYPDPISNALEIIFTGCNHKCPGCHAEALQDYTVGDIYTINEAIMLINYRAKQLKTDKIVLVGGDPLHPKNREFTKALVLKLYKSYDICIYTGYVAEVFKELNNIPFKFLKVGKYDINKAVLSEKTGTYMQFASTNQELYDSSFRKLSESGRYYF